MLKVVTASMFIKAEGSDMPGPHGVYLTVATSLYGNDMTVPYLGLFIISLLVKLWPLRSHISAWKSTLYITICIQRHCENIVLS